MYYTYIIYSQRLDRYYAGSTNNLSRRLEDHNRGKDKYTRKGSPWELTYFETFSARKDAYNRECEIKRQKSRSYIEQLILSKKH